MVSPTGIEYEPGIPPSETRFSQTAALYLRSDDPDRALALAREGIEEHPDNPIHYFLAGVAYARLDRYEESDAMFVEAEALYPAYELDIEPEREAAWADAFNQGVEAVGGGDTEGAIEAWMGATRIFNLRPEAHRNLAQLLADEGRYGEGADVLRDGLEGLGDRPATRVLEEEELREREDDRRRMERELADFLMIAERYEEAEPFLRARLERDSADVDVRRDLAASLLEQGRRAEAEDIYDELLSEDELEGTQIYNLGVSLFRTGDYARAASAFRRLTERRPQSRDAWFNYANALFAHQAWEDLLPVAARLLELDPLSENAALIEARTHLELDDEEAAVERLAALEALPVQVEGLVMRSGAGSTTVEGLLTGNLAEPGTPIRLRFTFHSDGERLGSREVEMPAPPEGESEPLHVEYEERATSYSYELVSSGS